MGAARRIFKHGRSAVRSSNLGLRQRKTAKMSLRPKTLFLVVLGSLFALELASFRPNAESKELFPWPAKVLRPDVGALENVGWKEMKKSTPSSLTPAGGKFDAMLNQLLRRITENPIRSATSDVDDNQLVRQSTSIIAFGQRYRNLVVTYSLTYLLNYIRALFQIAIRSLSAVLKLRSH